VNVVLVALDPETVNDVFDPGTTTEIHPPLPTACVFSKTLFVKDKGIKLEVVLAENMLMEPPYFEEYPLLNVDETTINSTASS